MIPSSDQIASDSRPCSSRIRARQRQAPGGVDAAAERAQHADPPVPDLVAEALDHDRAVARHDAGRLLLLAQVLDEVDRGLVVEVVFVGELRRILVHGPAGEGADRLAQLAGPAEPVALPERDGARDARRRRDDHAVARDLLDPPARRAEQEHLAGARLVDHLLVELADAAAVRQVDAEQAAVRDRAGVRDRERPAALARADRAVDAVPHDPRPQLAELLGRIAAVQHVQHVLELRARQLAVRVGAREHRRELVDGERLLLVRGGHRDDLLREHVERVARDDRGLDLPLAHALGDDRALEQVGAELGEEATLRRIADVVAGAPDPLQAGRDRLR